MQFILVSLTAFIASGLTLFSGFGLGTILLPVLAIFFPTKIAIAMTAVVHLANNLFKFVLLGRKANLSIALHFGLPAVIASFAGAVCLTYLASHTLWLNRVIAVLIIIFVILELFSSFKQWAIRSTWLPLGGLLSGFFGGLSGHQGVLRSAFLWKSGLTKEQFIATNVVIAVFVDLCRLLVYSRLAAWAELGNHALLLFVGTVSAFLGAFLGNLLVAKTTLRGLQIVVAVFLIAFAVGLGLGWL